MADDLTPDMFEEQMATEQPTESIYLLTSVRQLIRILDIGLIVPELVACTDDVIAVFNSEQLPTLHTITGYPMIPVLLELDNNMSGTRSVYPSSTIKTIHFTSQDELDDYLARGFENVPNGLFNFNASPSLFINEAGESQNASLSKIDKSALRKNYRQYDVLAGLVWDSIIQAMTPYQVNELLSNIVQSSISDDVSSAIKSWIKYKAKSNNLATEDSALMGIYVQSLGGRDIDEGWSSDEVLEDLANQLEPAVVNSEAFQKWYQYSKAVITNEKELSTLSDGGDVLLRAILLHILNPDSESIERMSLRDNAPGPKVLSIARALAAIRLGFAPLHAEEKLELPGAYWLVSDLIASFINKHTFDLNDLITETDAENGEKLSWRGQTVHHYTRSTSGADSTEEFSSAVKEEDATYLSLIDLQHLIEDIDVIESTSIEDGKIILQLTKDTAKPLPKQATFELSMNGANGVIITSRLLDLSMTSHKAKLTGKRMMAALCYQTEQGCDFRFETREDEYFSAQIALAIEITTESFRAGLVRLFDCHDWMKAPLK